jgi:nitrile hydratase
MEKRDDDKQKAKLVARAWLDPAFRTRLQTSPASALEEFDIAVPRGVKIVVVEDTEKVMHVTIPSVRSATPGQRRR